MNNDWKKFIPRPVCEDVPEYEELYMKAWELAHDHVKHQEGLPQTPYMDEAFDEIQIWIWDTCFMALFCKFGGEEFPGVESFRNFYEILYDGKTLPKVMAEVDSPRHSKKKGEMYDMNIHISDNPPLFAFGEYENALMSGDLEHIKDLLLNKKYLQKHYDWIESLREPVTPRGVRHPSCLISEELGYRWEGGRSGMDNTPRGRDRAQNGKVRPNNPDLLWVDAICQQALSASMIAKLYALIGDESGAEEWRTRFEEKKDIINKYYWDEQDGFYYDIDINSLDFCKVMTIASFWALTSGVASKEQAESLSRYAADPDTFGGDVPLISLARNDGDYYPDGRYWRGGLWLPTAYAALKGLSSYGFHDVTHSAGRKILDHMLKTYKTYEHHTIWECYAPEKAEPALCALGDEICRPDFCGWSALGPISVYIEYVLGFHSINAFTRTVEWAKPEGFKGEIGIKDLRFGDTVTSITAKDGICRVISDKPYTLIVNGKSFDVRKGENELAL